MNNGDLKFLKVQKNCMFLTCKEAASYLYLSAQTLNKMRIMGTGPQFRKHGRYVRYHIDDLDAWSEERRHRSTSEERKQ